MVPVWGCAARPFSRGSFLEPLYGMAKGGPKAKSGQSGIFIDNLSTFAFLLLIDRITPHLHPVGGPEGPKSKLSKTTMLALAVTIQNVPEGAIISMPLRAVGNSRWRAFGVGALSGVVEPIGGALVILLASAVTPMMPYLLAFAAGAMLYVVVEELVPEASQGEHSNIATVGFALGFALMMVLDVLMG